MTVFMPVDNARIMDFHARKVGFIAIAKTNRNISAAVLEQQMISMIFEQVRARSLANLLFSHVSRLQLLLSEREFECKAVARFFDFSFYLCNQPHSLRRSARCVRTVAGAGRDLSFR
jgi:hypothetical protein